MYSTAQLRNSLHVCKVGAECCARAVAESRTRASQHHHRVEGPGRRRLCGLSGAPAAGLKARHDAVGSGRRAGAGGGELAQALPLHARPHILPRDCRQEGARQGQVSERYASAKKRPHAAAATPTCHHHRGHSLAPATVSRMAHLGISTALRSMATNGIVACTARNHCGLNVLQCSRHAPHGRLAAIAVPPMASALRGRMGRGAGLRRRREARRQRQACVQRHAAGAQSAPGRRAGLA